MNTQTSNQACLSGQSAAGSANYALIVEWSLASLRINPPYVAKLFTRIEGKQVEIDLVECGVSERGVEQVLVSEGDVAVVIFGETLNTYNFTSVEGFLEKCKNDLAFLERAGRKDWNKL